MIPEKQLQALLRLLDDPDDEVARVVVARLLDYGPEVIPQLEKAWEKIGNEALQEQLETLIHQVHFAALQEDFRKWNALETPSLLQGAILLSRYAYPGLRTETVLAQFERIRLNVWLETNTYLSPIEQVNAFNSILYGYCRLSGTSLSKQLPAPFFINTLLDSRQGNVFSLGVLYLALSERLDVPLFAVNIPQHFLLAYMDAYQPAFAEETSDNPARHIRFYVDPLNGNIYSPLDVANYLRKMGIAPSVSHYLPLSIRQILQHMMTALMLTYEHAKKPEKAAELRLLISVITDEEEQEENGL